MKLNKKSKRKLLSEEEIEAKFKGVEFEKNDTTAMIIAALITFLPPFLLMMGIIYGVIWLLFLR